MADANAVTVARFPRKFAIALTGLLFIGLAAMVINASMPTPIPTTTPTFTSTATQTATPTITPTFTPTATPSATATPAESPTPLMRTFRGNCSTDNSVVVDGEQHHFCATSGPGVAIAEIMSDPDNLIDDDGQPLELSILAGCRTDPVCPSFVWHRKNDLNKGIALMRQWPSKIKELAVAPILVWNKTGDSRNINNWQVFLVDKSSGKIVQVGTDAFVRFDEPYGLLFNSATGYYERVRESAGRYIPIGQSAGMQLTQPIEPVGAAEGIRLFKFSEEDAPRFQNILDWMWQTTPSWYQYILGQRPLDIYLNPQLGDWNWIGRGACCWAIDHGRIELEYRPPKKVFDDLYYTVTLIHEATHVADMRAKKPFVQARGVEACRAAERSATENERAFLADLLKTSITGQDKIDAQYLLKAADQKLANGKFDWNPACRD